MNFFRNQYVKLMMKSIRIPLILVILGCLLLSFALIDDYLHIVHWKRLFDFSDLLGNICLAMAGVTFLYLFGSNLLLQFEMLLREKHRILALVASTIRRGLRIIYFLVSLYIVIDIIGPDDVYIMLTKNIINIGIIASLGWIAIESVSVIEEMIYHYTNTMSLDHNRIKTLQTKTRILSSIASVVIGVVAFAAILMSFDTVRSVGISLLASAGFLTAIAGFAASKTLFSLFSGIQIVLSQTVNIGDTIVIEKEQGIVEEIAFTYVILKLGDNRRLTVPINYFVDKPFENWSRDSSGMRTSLYFYVDYMMPIEPLRVKLNEILSSTNLWDGVFNKLQVGNLAENVVQMKIQMSASDAEKLSDLRAEVREKILRFIQEKYPEYLPKVRSVVSESPSLGGGEADASISS